MAYLSHYTGEIIPDQQAFEERAAFRTLTWKGTAWNNPSFGSDVVPFLIQSNLSRQSLIEARSLIQTELGEDDDLYRVTGLALRTEESSVFLDVSVLDNTLVVQVL